ncbi:transmembrane protein 114 isoform X1 [Tiliqua scincoides]|uniref:transmembrane protein 114 isoform X1 n=1 Tax=Tiliqua scincoides TaxID=71010 RepID=UPI0034626942
MKVTLNGLSLFVALFGILSFTFLVIAMGTDFWYLIDASKLEKLSNHTDSLSSHSGLWRTCRFEGSCFPLVNPFGSERANITASHKQLLNMHGTFLILLPLSLFFLIFGGITGFISILAQCYFLLWFSGLLFLSGALITLIGVSVYIAYSMAAFREAIFLLGKKDLLDNLNIHFGWSLVLAWLSFVTAVLTGLAFLLAARMVDLKRRQDRSI